MINIFNNKEKIDNNQELYDAYNAFLMSDDRRIFFKMCLRIQLYNMVKDLHGDIVECGVFKGSGVFLWLKLLELNEPNSLKKVIGFDFFDQSFVNNLENITDRESMKSVFQRDQNLTENDISIEKISNKLFSSGFKKSKFELIKGDIAETSRDFLKYRPGFRISLLYLDLDLEEPTTATLNSFYDRVVSGGIIVFDEYAYHTWSESNAVDRFVKEKNLKLFNTGIETPTAYIIKP
jgi:Macrocin-O-methyltransferase (TylF)